MPSRNQSNKRNSSAGDVPNKDPGKPKTDINEDPEASQSMDPFIMQTQRGQGKEDGDPSEESDQPLKDGDTRY